MKEIWRNQSGNFVEESWLSSVDDVEEVKGIPRINFLENKNLVFSKKELKKK